MHFILAYQSLSALGESEDIPDFLRYACTLQYPDHTLQAIEAFECPRVCGRIDEDTAKQVQHQVNNWFLAFRSRLSTKNEHQVDENLRDQLIRYDKGVELTSSIQDCPSSIFALWSSRHSPWSVVKIAINSGFKVCATSSVADKVV